METQQFTGSFASAAKRVAFSYLKSLSEFCPVTPQGDAEPQAAMHESQRDLHGFFQALYQALYDAPEVFGLPVTPDICIGGEGEQDQRDKQEVNRKLQKPRDLIAQGLDFLLAAGTWGRLDGQDLLIVPWDEATYLPKPRTARKFLEGMAPLGLALTVSGDRAVLRNTRFPAMMPALQAMAQRCSQHADPQMGRFHFDRCDYKALAQDEPEPLEMYRIFNAADFERIAELHAFFTGRGYKPIIEVHGVSAWVVKYQGKRTVKASPLFQVEFQDRRSNPLMVFIKCASTNRIAPLLEQQSQALQDDFLARTFRCRGADCGWCKTRKQMGPSLVHRNGEKVTVCWYSNPDVKVLDDASTDLIRQYAIMHEALG